MLLSDREIVQEFCAGKLFIDPFDEKFIQPASLDVRLDRYFRVFNSHEHECIDPAEEQPALMRDIRPADGEPFVLHPREFALAATYERLTVPRNLAARVEGRSSLGRLGLLTHSTAGWLDPGFTGHITLELFNVSGLPIRLWPGMRISQVCFFRMNCPARQPYQGRYQNQPRGPVASRSWQGFERWPPKTS